MRIVLCYPKTMFIRHHKEQVSKKENLLRESRLVGRDQMEFLKMAWE